GGVHSSFDHIKALIKMAADNGLKKVYVHAFLDGRDTPPKSAVEFLAELENELKKYNLPQIATISGRYYAMDRDNRWERVEKAYNALLFGEGEKADNSDDAIKASYAKDVTDEFVLPTITNSDPNSRIKDNDAIIFFNYRPDRAREITRAMTFENFDGFVRKARRNNLYYVCMAQYDETFPLPIAYPPEKLTNILGDVLDDNGVKQYRTAETEKYAHVTFFFNGGVEEPNEGEDRILVDSPKYVPTYDKKPRMSAYTVCDEVCKAITSGKYDVIITNFANPDMVGHTGVVDAAVKAIEVIDECVGEVVEFIKEVDGQLFICADHGNAEQLIDYETGEPYTAHTTNPVPFILVNADPKYGLREGGVLADIVPTLIELMGMKQPEEMTGKSLLIEK
uniref:2,3-bisphosphoglycerate-independent phosphoglycerate mutase n=1 Tax=uncultured Eubacterium sp. TaxID=165185 RepID=UPI0026145FD5